MSTHNVDDYSVAEGGDGYAALSLDMMYPSSWRKEGRQFVIMYPTGQSGLYRVHYDTTLFKNIYMGCTLVVTVYASQKLIAAEWITIGVVRTRNLSDSHGINIRGILTNGIYLLWHN